MGRQWANISQRSRGISDLIPRSRAANAKAKESTGPSEPMTRLKLTTDLAFTKKSKASQLASMRGADQKRIQHQYFKLVHQRSSGSWRMARQKDTRSMQSRLCFANWRCTGRERKEPINWRGTSNHWCCGRKDRLDRRWREFQLLVNKKYYN